MFSGTAEVAVQFRVRGQGLEMMMAHSLHLRRNRDNESHKCSQAFLRRGGYSDTLELPAA